MFPFRYQLGTEAVEREILCHVRLAWEEIGKKNVKKATEANVQ